MPLLVITRPPQFTDPWFAEIEQVWDELELSINNLDGRVVTLEGLVISGTGVVKSLSKSGDPQITGDVTLTGAGSIVLTQVGSNIQVGGGGVSDHGALTGLLDDDHTQYLLADGTRALGGNWNVGSNQLINVRVENLITNPLFGSPGRLLFNTTDLRLKVDTGAAIVDVGVTDHGLLSGLADDDHLQYLLTDGTRAVTGDLTVNGKYKNLNFVPLVIESQETDSALAVGTIIDTDSNMVTAGALLVSVRNAGVEKFAIDKDGNVTTSGSILTSLTSLNALIDTDNDSSSEAFNIKMDDPNEAFATLIMSVNEAGELNLPFGSIRVGTVGIPSDTLDVDGNADFSGNITLSGSALIRSVTNLDFQVDYDNNESAFFNWFDGTGATIMQLDESGNLLVTGTITGGSSPFNFISRESDSGSAIAYVLDTQNPLIISGANLLSIRNNGTDKFVIDKDGTIIAGGSPFKMRSKEVDGASAVGYELDTVNNLATAGAKLLVLKNFGVEKFSVDKDGNFSGNFVSTVSPSAGGAGIQAAIIAVNTAGGGIVQLLAGTYVVSSSIVWPVGCSNVTLRGVGHGTILSSTINDNTANVFNLLNTSTANPQTKNISATTRGNTSITTTLASDGALFLANMPIFIQGTDPDGKEWVEENEVLANGSGITGVVTLKSKVTRTLTSAFILIAFADGFNNAIRDLKVIHSSGISHAIRTSAQHGFTIDNCFFNGSTFSGGYAMHVKAFNSTISNNKIWNYNVAGGDIAGFGNMATGYGLKITKNEIINCGAVGEASRCGFALGDNSSPAVSECLFEDNLIINSQGIGLSIRGSGPVRGLRILGNVIKNSETDGISTTSENSELVISNNVCSYNGQTTGTGIAINSSTYLTVDSNIMEYNKDDGLRVSSGDRLTITDNFVRKNTDEGMYFPTCTHATVTGNTIVDNTVDAGIYLQNCTDMVVSGNNLDANKTGIKLVNTCVDILISGNTSRNNVTSGLEISNTSSNVLFTGNNFRGQTISLGTGANIISAGNME